MPNSLVVKKLFERARRVHGDLRYRRLAGISISHIVNFNHSFLSLYRTCSVLKNSTSGGRRYRHTKPFLKKFVESSIGEVENKAAFYAENLVDYSHVHVVELVFRHRRHESPQAKFSEPSVNLSESVLLPLILTSVAERLGSLHEVTHTRRPEIIYVTKFFGDKTVAFTRRFDFKERQRHLDEGGDTIWIISDTVVDVIGILVFHTIVDGVALHG